MQAILPFSPHMDMGEVIASTFLTLERESGEKKKGSGGRDGWWDWIKYSLANLILSCWKLLLINGLGDTNIKSTDFFFSSFKIKCICTPEVQNYLSKENTNKEKKSCM